jgi:hypothetical protein
MGDRSWAQFAVPVEYADLVGEKIFEGWERSRSSWEENEVLFYNSEKSGGGYDESGEVMRLGVPFHHEWGACEGAYPAGREVHIPGMGCFEASLEGPVAAIDENGVANPDDVARAVAFHRASALFELALGEGR